jgi:AcrR family transcriptional regulator
MEAARSRPPAKRRPLSKERVLRAAVKLADRDGLEALSMRRLAKELGVEAMSLYNHVKNKDEILSGISDLVTSEMELPSDTTDWQSALRRSSISAKEVYLRHPWASSLVMSSHDGGQASLRRSEWTLRTLREAGFSKDLTYHAYHILGAYVQGVTNQHLSFPYKPEEVAGLASDFLRQLPQDEFTYLIEHVVQHTEPTEAHKGGFELGLDLILEGLERMRDAA